VDLKNAVHLNDLYTRCTFDITNNPQSHTSCVAVARVWNNGHGFGIAGAGSSSVSSASTVTYILSNQIRSFTILS